MLLIPAAGPLLRHGRRRPADPRKRARRFLQTIREQLAEPIRAAGIARIARETGLQRSNLSAWLNGRGRLADEHVEAICRHLNLTLTIAPRE